MDLKIVKADISLFRKYERELLDIYMEICTDEIMQQHLDREEEKEYMLGVFKAGGYAFFAFDGDKFIGDILAGPLSHDKLLPESIKQNYPVDKCFYIEEMHMHKNYRGKGIGTKLFKSLKKEIDRNKYDYLFIRAWAESTPAINLYKQFGFVPDTIMDQKKIKKDRSGTFIIKKQYLVQKLK